MEKSPTSPTTVLVPVGTQLHSRDFHAGLAAGWHLSDLLRGWDSHAGTHQLVSGRTPTLVLKHSDLDLIVIQLSYPAAINDPGYMLKIILPRSA